MGKYVHDVLAVLSWVLVYGILFLVLAGNVHAENPFDGPGPFPESDEGFVNGFNSHEASSDLWYPVTYGEKVSASLWQLISVAVGVGVALLVVRLVVRFVKRIGRV